MKTKKRKNNALPFVLAPFLLRLISPFLGGFLFLVPGCDLDWEERAESAYQEGVVYQKAEDWIQARHCFARALSFHPYHLPANRTLANLLDIYFWENGLAATYYARSCELETEPSQREALLQHLRMLREMDEGKIEDPIYAIEDFLWSIEQRSKRVFYERYRPEEFFPSSIEDPEVETYLRAWRERVGGRKSRILSRNWMETNKERPECRIVVQFLPEDEKGEEEFLLAFRLLLSREKPVFWEIVSPSIPPSDSHSLTNP